MSEIRKATAPHPMDPKPEAAKPEPIVEATKAPSKAKPVPARKNAKGESLRCAVHITGLDRLQCQNPARHPVGRRFVCTTHSKQIAAGRKNLVWEDGSKATVNQALWLGGAAKRA